MTVGGIQKTDLGLMNEPLLPNLDFGPRETSAYKTEHSVTPLPWRQLLWAL